MDTIVPGADVWGCGSNKRTGQINDRAPGSFVSVGQIGKARTIADMGIISGNHKRKLRANGASFVASRKNFALMEPVFRWVMAHRRIQTIKTADRERTIAAIAEWCGENWLR